MSFRFNSVFHGNAHMISPHPEKPSIQQTISDLVSAIVPFDNAELHQIQDTLTWIESGAPLFRLQKPDIPPKHLSVYFALFDEDARKVLLVDHKKAQLWVPAG